MTCPRCQVGNRSGLKFCEHCGASLAPICRHCAAPIAGDASFCGSCGSSLAAPALGRFATPGGYTPKYLADRILSSRSALEGERKQVTVLFCDLANSTSLAELIGPEAMHGLLDGFFDLALSEIHRYEGTINQFLGDGFMALFGAPLAREDHPRRAVLAALGIQRALQERRNNEEPTGGKDLDVRMGLNTGLVVVGKIGDNLRMDYTAVGGTTHVASRLEQLAEPGSIVISEATYRLVRGYVRVEDLGAVSVKGKTDAIQAYKVIGPGSRRSRLEGAEAPTLTRFVGRERELGILQGLLDRAEAGEGQVVGIVGESGVGKSRLFHEFRQSQRGRSVTFLEGRCLSYGASIPYLPVLDILRQSCGITETDGPGAIAQKVEWSLNEVGIDSGEAAAYVLHLLGVKAGTEKLAALSPQAIKNRSSEVLRQLTFNESRRRPLVMLVEDLQWVDKTSEEYARSLIDAIAGAPVMVVLTYRPGYQPPWMEKSYSTQIALQHLSAEESLAVVRAIVPAERTSDSVSRLILARAEGNPLFLEELSRAASERRQLGGGELPETIHDVLSARIDSLGELPRRVVQAAAVLGREVSVRLLEALSDEPESLDDTLRELKDREFLYERPGAGERICVFKHALIQEVAYATLLEQRRVVLHGRVARTLEALYERRTDEVVELLAHHFGRSGNAEKTVDYAILAGEKAQRRWANAEALTHFGTALARLESLPESQANSWRRIDAVLRQGEVQFALGHHVEQRTRLEQIGPLVERDADPPRRAAWHYWIGFLHSLTGSRPEVAIAHCAQAVAIAESSGLFELSAFAESCLAQVYVFAGELRRGVEVGERALRTFEALGNRWWAGRTLSHLAAAANALGRWDQALGYCERALNHGVAVDDLRLKASALLRMGLTHIQKGEIATGMRRCEEVQALSPTPYDAAAVRGIRAYGLIKEGRVAEAITELKEVLDWYVRSDLRFTRYQFTLWLGEAYLKAGALDLAQGVSEEVLAASGDVGYGHLEAIAHRLLGECLIPADTNAAAQHLTVAVESLRRSGARDHLGKALLSQAALRRAQRDVPGARAALEESLAIFEEIGTLDEPRRVREALAMLDAGRSAGGRVDNV
jgi:class 3 adenylate cyclase/tetratricopeptide (TPR) repeat protein